MAMITCPNCGEQISDKAKKCVHCGIEFPEKKTILVCSECGTELEEGTTICPKCGCPTSQNQEDQHEPHQVQITGVKVAEKNKKKIGLIALAAVVVLVLIFGGLQINKKNYIKTLSQTSSFILSSAADAEDAGNLIKSVWNNSIHKTSSKETDKYTRPNGYFVSDFNDALGNLFSDVTFTSNIDSIKADQDRITSMMKDLKNPPEKYKEAYDAVNDFYDAYIKLSNAVINPTGSLTSFSQNFNDADSETADCYSKMKVYLD